MIGHSFIIIGNTDGLHDAYFKLWENKPVFINPETINAQPYFGQQTILIREESNEQLR